MNRPLGRLGAAATLGQHCPQMAQNPICASLSNLIRKHEMRFHANKSYHFGHEDLFPHRRRGTGLNETMKIDWYKK